ncbi:MAG: nitrilase-related carbon-nitrogen hydrolase, partial [Gemmatimonadota bacterium]
MSASPNPFRVAAVQAAPVPFDREAAVQKACDRTADLGRQGVQLALFPEAFVPAYPRGLGFGTVVGHRTAAGRALWERYWDQSVLVPGPQTEQLGQAAGAAGLYLAIGVIERGSGGDRGTLYCTLLYFGPDGRLLGKHRKLKPTAAERLIWGEGDGSTLTAIDTPFGTVGGLICWENYMPLARTAMYPPEVAGQVAGDSGLCRGGSAIVGPLGEVLAGPVYD